jgi:hypothetical protein
MAKLLSHPENWKRKLISQTQLKQNHAVFVRVGAIPAQERANPVQEFHRSIAF